MAERVKCLPLKHEDLNSDSQKLHKIRQGCVCSQPQHCEEEGSQLDSWSLLVSQVSQAVSPRFSVSREIMWRVTEEGTHTSSLLVRMHRHVHVHSYTHVYFIHTYKNTKNRSNDKLLMAKWNITLTQQFHLRELKEDFQVPHANIHDNQKQES